MKRKKKTGTPPRAIAVRAMAAVMAATVAGVLVKELPAMRRYWKMETM